MRAGTREFRGNAEAEPAVRPRNDCNAVYLAENRLAVGNGPVIAWTAPASATDSLVYTRYIAATTPPATRGSLTMSDPTFLVTGATGSTGAHAVRYLREADWSVRAMVHREDERSAALAEVGADVIVGDLLDMGSVRAALDDVTRAYFVYPIVPGLLYATAGFAQAAREAGVEMIVNMSQISARPDTQSNAAREHWLAERIFDWAGIGVTHLRPTFFADWFTYTPVAFSILTDGKLQLPFGSGRHAPIAAEDQARVIVSILKDPEAHRGQTYELFGPVEGTHTDHAAAIGRALGRSVEYEPVPIELFKAAVKAAYPDGDHLAQHLGGVAVDYQNGIFSGTNDVIERITGEPPMTLEAFITRNADNLERNAAKLGASASA